MRIFLICQQTKKKYSVPAYEFWEEYFKRGIEEAGHQWLEAPGADWVEGLVHSDNKSLQEWRYRTWTKTLTDLKFHHQSQPIDLVISYLFPQQVEPAAINEIQDLGIPCVNFFCDNVREFLHVPTEFYCFTLNWVPEYKALRMYQKANLRYIHAPMPVWIPPSQRTYNHTEVYGISFIGSRDIQREVLFADAICLGIEVELRGAGWQYQDANKTDALNAYAPKQSIWKTIQNQFELIGQDGFASGFGKLTYKLRPKIPDNAFQGCIHSKPDTQEYVNILQQSQITLGVNRYPSYRYPFSRPDTYSRMRDVEAPMMGACYLTEWTEGLEYLYDLGEEIETYRDADEMADKIEQLIGDPKRRLKMRCQAQKRALAEHTVPKTLSNITKILGLNRVMKV
jgi:hypothetical protein